MFMNNNLIKAETTTCAVCGQRHTQLPLGMDNRK